MNATVVGPQNTWYTLQTDNIPLWMYLRQNLQNLQTSTLAVLVEIEFLLSQGGVCIAQTDPHVVIEELKLGLNALGITDIESAIHQARHELAHAGPSTLMVRLEKHLV